MSAVLTEFLQLMTSGIKTMAQNIGSGISTCCREMFTTYTTTGTGDALTYNITGLSTFGAVVAIFAGISLAFGLTRLVFNLVKSH